MGVRLLTVRDRTRAELARLLDVRGFDRADSQVALDRLQEQGYLNDRRFATAWARGRLRTKPMGSYRLGKELEVKGVEEQLVREVLEDLYEEGEEPAARRAMAGKLSALGRLPASARTLRVGRFLHRRGFSSELIWRLLHEEQQG
ncbi:regulatory protein RecX [Candidatus Methylomirabilis sp.]|uniref:regulatory protein RecX n=1 Tax=Candidatus Methylomirabilis sp. TaxID=2032687 RepID=UPI003C71AF16